MLNLTKGIGTVVLGVLIVVAPASNALPDNNDAYLGASPESAHAHEDPTPRNAVAMGPDSGGQASAETVDQDRGDSKPTPSPSPTPSPNPREEENLQQRSDNSRLQEDCDGPPSAVRTHCLVYLELRRLMLSLLTDAEIRSRSSLRNFPEGPGIFPYVGIPAVR